MRIFLDANILFSAALTDGVLRSLLKVLFQRSNCLTNDYAIDEARRNLEQTGATTLRRLKSLVRQCELVTSIRTDVNIDLAPKDVPILGGAIAGGATHLLTGDKRDFGSHFGKTL